MKTVFIGHTYHFENTKSSQFFIDILKESFGVEPVITHDPLVVKDSHPDTVVIWQRLFPPQAIDWWQAKNIILCPMYDACPHDLAFWNQYKKYKIFCFSKTLYDMLLSAGFSCLYAQYYLKPDTKRALISSEVNAFFWERTPSLTWKQVARAAQNLPVTHLHFHTGLSQNKDMSSRPTPEYDKKYSITYTDWFKDKAQMQSVLDSTDIYFAPRVSEGIGLSFIEALARGCIVAAWDAPTMNEYITDGVDGILYSDRSDFAKPYSIEELNMLKAKSIERASAGYDRWNASGKRIMDFLREPIDGYMPQRTCRAALYYTVLRIKRVIKTVIRWEHLRPLLRR